MIHLETVASHDDVERLDAFNAGIHGPSVTSFTRELILHHPNTRPENWLSKTAPRDRS